MSLFSFIRRKNCRTLKDDTKHISNTAVELQEVKTATKPLSEDFSQQPKSTQTKKRAHEFSPDQLDYIEKYKAQTISVLDIPQNIFDNYFCKAVVEINAHAISFIPQKFVTLELCQIAVAKNPLVIKNIPEEFRIQIADYEKLEKRTDDFRKEKDKSTAEEMEAYIPGHDKTFAPDSGLYNAGGSLSDQFEYYKEH